MLDDILTHGRFKWGGRWQRDNGQVDCLGLVIEARFRLCPDAPLLPNFDWIYECYHRESLPPRKLLSLVRHCPGAVRVDMPGPGDVALLQSDRGLALGTFTGDAGVLLFGNDERPIIEPDYTLPNLLSYWSFCP